MLAQKSRVKIKTYEPLTFMCIACGALFDASGKSGEQLTAEIEQHMNQQHLVKPQAA